MQDALEHRVRLARGLPAKARCEALAHALHAARDDAERHALATELLELAIVPGVGPRAGAWERLWASRRRTLSDDALSRLCRAWTRLPPETRSQLAAVGQGRWAALADDLFSSADIGTQASACGLAETMSDPALVEKLPSLLGSADESVRKDAAEAMLRLTAISLDLDLASLAPDLVPVEPDRAASRETTHFSGSHGVEDLSALVECLSGVLKRGLESYQDHQQRPVALAALLVLAIRPLAIRLPARRDDPAAQAIRGVLRFSRSPASRHCAWRLLGSAGFGEAARDRVARAYTLGDHEAILTSGHLALHPARASSLAMIPVRARATPMTTDNGAPAMVRLTMAREAPLPDGSWVELLSVEARRNLARVAMAFGVDDTTLRAVLDPMLADEDPLARMSAMRASGEATLLDFCFDPSGAISRGAISRWSLAGAAHYATAPVRRRQLDMLAKLARSPHAGVRRIAGEDLRRLDPFLADDPACVMVARRRCTHDREAFLVDMRHVLMSGSGESRLLAIRMARRLGLVREIEPLLIAMVTHGASAMAHERALATAVMALGDLDSVPARQTVRWALRHSDARVRANAVEALGRQEVLRGSLDGAGRAPGRQALLELKGDAHPRVRANAIAALLHESEEASDGLYAPTSGSALIAMLRDERGEHRVSALWLAGRTLLAVPGTGGSALLAHVESLAGGDVEPAIRRRAARVIQRIHARRALVGSSGLGGTSDTCRGPDHRGSGLTGSGMKAEDQRC